MLLPIGFLVLAVTVAAPSKPVDAERDLPPPPPFDDAAPTPVIDATPPAPVLATAPPGRSPAAPEPVRTRPSLLSGLPWLEGGFGSVSMQLTNLAGSVALLTGFDLHATRGAWALGARFLSGGNPALGLTTGALHGSWTFFSDGVLDVSAGAQLLGGTASAGALHTGVVAFAPEVAVDARLLPWLRAHAALDYRLVNAFAWEGPPGDQLSGPGLTLGLAFGTP